MAQSKIAAGDSVKRVQRIPDNWFGQDKAKHFLLSALLTGAVSHYAYYDHHQTREESRNIAVAFVFTLGIGKEMKDRQRPSGYFSWKDLVFDVLGIAVGIGVLNRWQMN